jgi:hypothetical protein
VQKITLPQFLLLLLAGWLMLGDQGGGCTLPIISEPPPFKADKLCVLVVEETDDRGTYTAGQREAIISLDGPGSIRGYVKAKGGEYLLWDKDQQPTANSPKWVADALKVRGDKLPSIVAATPKTGFGPRELPKDAAETIAALKKIGGE